MKRTKKLLRYDFVIISENMVNESKILDKLQVR
jgi:hypothetical protein